MAIAKGATHLVVSGHRLPGRNSAHRTAIISIGPSLYAVILYLTYRFGLVQPHALDIVLDHMVYSAPVDFAP
jgi:hypothetical protein